MKEEINKPSPANKSRSSPDSDTFNKLTTHLIKLGFAPTTSKILALQFVDSHLGGRTNTTGGIDILLLIDYGVDVSKSIHSLTNTFTPWKRVNTITATTPGLFGFTEHGLPIPGVITRDATQLVFIENATEINSKNAGLFKEVIDTETIQFVERHGKSELSCQSNLTFLTHTQTISESNTPLIHDPPVHPAILNAVDLPVKITPQHVNKSEHSSVASEKQIPEQVSSTLRALPKNELQWVELGVDRVKTAKQIFIEKTVQTEVKSAYQPTPKRLEKTLIKLSEAHARTRQSPTITHEDVNTALRLMFEVFSQFHLGWGPESTHPQTQTKHFEEER